MNGKSGVVFGAFTYKGLDLSRGYENASNKQRPGCVFLAAGTILGASPLPITVEHHIFQKSIQSNANPALTLYLGLLRALVTAKSARWRPDNYRGCTSPK
jgi:hypothetical protein